MPSDDRERSFENALARHLHADTSAGDPRSTCCDAETLAAYHEHSLGPEQMASLKTHVADCERCQQILAHLEDTHEITAVAASTTQQATADAKSGVRVLHPRRPTLWRWVAPAGALAAALLVWVAVHENNSVRVPPQGPRVDLKEAETAKNLPASAPPLTLPPSLDATPKDEATSSDTLAELYAAPQSRSAVAPKQRYESLLKQKGSGSAGKKSSVAVDELADNSRNRNALPALQPKARSDANGKATNDNRDALFTDAPQVAGETSSAAGAAAAAPPAPDTARAELHSESAAVSGRATQQQEIGGMSPFKRKALMRLANSIGEVTISAPGGRVSWRVGEAGIIEFSSDARKTWTLQPSGVITDLLAGSAPSDKVCWIVGRSGTILRTTDGGGHWQKVRPPTPDDLRSVFAVDARQATVSPANGTYQTTDGGVTWNKLAPE
jgi:hypothetical protein